MSTARVMSNNYKRATLGATNSSNNIRSITSNHSSNLRSTLSTSNSHLKASNSRLSALTPLVSSKSNSKSTSMTNLSHATLTRSTPTSKATTTTTAAARMRQHSNLNNNNANTINNNTNKLATISSGSGKNLSHIPTPKQQLANNNQAKISTTTTSATTKLPFRVPTDRTSLINKLRALQEQIDRQELERERLTGELERVSSDKEEQINQLKGELHEKLCEHEKQNEQYHQKLLEAYEMADQNRKAADQALVEARQRDEESRNKLDELEGQLNEVREFMAQKEQMAARLRQLEEQIREEKDKYEGQVKNLHEMVEKEKIRSDELGHELTELMRHRDLARDHRIVLNNTTHQEEIIISKEHHHHNNLENASIIVVDNSNRSGSRAITPSSNDNISDDGVREDTLYRARLNKSKSTDCEDMYGSKLSTRMHDTARSAWKASKNFASTVISNGVTSSCRYCNVKDSGKNTTTPRPQADANNNGHSTQSPTLSQSSLPGDHTACNTLSCGQTLPMGSSSSCSCSSYHNNNRPDNSHSHLSRSSAFDNHETPSNSSNDSGVTNISGHSSISKSSSNRCKSSSNINLNKFKTFLSNLHTTATTTKKHSINLSKQCKRANNDQCQTPQTITITSATPTPTPPPPSSNANASNY